MQYHHFVYTSGTLRHGVPKTAFMSFTTICPHRNAPNESYLFIQILLYWTPEQCSQLCDLKNVFAL